MATYKKGILGVFSGKVGTVIGSTWKGIDYMRSLPKQSGKAATQKQLDQRFRFGMINSFFKPLSVLIEKGFQSVKGNLTPLNAAVSYHLKEAITGISPNFEIDLTKVIFSRGELLSPWLPTAIAGTSGKIDFGWQSNAGSSYAKADDQAVMLVYNPTTREYVFLENAAIRTDSQFTLTLPTTFSGVEVHCWMSYFAADGASASTSVYIGKVTVI